jgi:hypothetical protein
MLRIMHVKEIEDLLLLLPGLVQQQERRSSDFAPSALAWLNSLEKVLTANRLYQAGTIATMRSALVAAEHGQAPTEIEFRGRPNRLRTLRAMASQALQRAAEVASTLVAENRPRLEEAERIAQQIIAAALSRELITARGHEMSSTEYLRILRRSLAMTADLERAVVHLEGLVGPHDTLILFHRALAPYFDESTPVANKVPGVTFTSE